MAIAAVLGGGAAILTIGLGILVAVAGGGWFLLCAGFVVLAATILFCQVAIHAGAHEAGAFAARPVHDDWTR
jgi:hypothetical protein